MSQTARNPAVDTCCSRPQPQSQLHPEYQHAPQPTVQASNNEAVKKKPATTVPVVWSADSVKVSKQFYHTSRNIAENLVKSLTLTAVDRISVPLKDKKKAQ